MQLKRVLAVAASAAMLTGCQTAHKLIHRHDNDYLKQSGTVPALKLPAGTSKKGMQPFYPVPSGQKNETTPPSIVPPGSGLQSKTMSTLKSGAKMALNAQGEQTLVLAMSQKKAWTDLKPALQKSGYQVLDQDQAMGAYYILDPKESGGKVTQKTPILRVNVQAKGGDTWVTLTQHDNAKLNNAIATRVLTSLDKRLG